jgi:uncharacterized protein YdeI (YjbR/CyaY-like superfamily)
MDELPTRSFADKKSWQDWLADNHAASDGLWLKIAKKNSTTRTVTYPEAVEVALCYGWIDSQLRSLDADFYLQRFTPRRSRSPWSAINRKKAEELIAGGAMHPAGLREVERAQADGRWDRAYEGSRNATVPADLQAALDASPAARAFFEALNRGERYSILYRIQDAKRPETRARRIAQFVTRLAEGRTIGS